MGVLELRYWEEQKQGRVFKANSVHYSLIAAASVSSPVYEYMFLFLSHFFDLVSDCTRPAILTALLPALRM
jgi:hypothetical protein